MKFYSWYKLLCVWNVLVLNMPLDSKLCFRISRTLRWSMGAWFWNLFKTYIPCLHFLKFRHWNVYTFSIQDKYKHPVSISVWMLARIFNQMCLKSRGGKSKKEKKLNTVECKNTYSQLKSHFVLFASGTSGIHSQMARETKLGGGGGITTRREKMIKKFPPFPTKESKLPQASLTHALTGYLGFLAQ